MSITDSRVRLSEVENSVRPAAVAGMFYPEQPEKLKESVKNLLNNAQHQVGIPKAIISPHAGYIYSGAAAAEAFAALQSTSHKVKRVVLLGPAHRVHLKGIAAPSVAAFRTPLGDIKLDRKALKQLESLPQVRIFDEAHEQEHCLEVQLPFLQACLGEFSLVPLVVGDTRPEEVADVLDMLWGGEETLIVISSDLSHYHEYNESRRIDQHTSSIIEDYDFSKLTPQQACGAYPVKGMLLCASKRNMKIDRRALCNSGDSAGSRDRVVGYGAWCLFEQQRYDSEQRKILKQLARSSIEHGFANNSAMPVDPSEYQGKLQEKAACFVTLNINGKLRGCIGSTHAHMPLVRAVADSAFSAAFKDPRFPALTEDEFGRVHMSISVLSPQEQIDFKDDPHLLELLRQGIDGLIIENGNRKATFLPSVWESLPGKKEFLTQLKSKAGIKKNESIKKAWRYTAEYFD